MSRELYGELREDPPDLMVYIDDLNWRPAGTIGWETNYLPENDRGPDDAVHDWYRVFIVYDPQETIKKEFVGEIGIENVLEKLLQFMTG